MADMADRSRERQPGVDRPEPDEALTGTAARTPDHEPSDLDDRPVELDDPASTEPPIDDDDRDPGGRERFPTK
jgi:hypothetical protein